MIEDGEDHRKDLHSIVGSLDEVVLLCMLMKLGEEIIIILSDSDLILFQCKAKPKMMFPDENTISNLILTRI